MKSNVTHRFTFLFFQTRRKAMFLLVVRDNTPFQWRFHIWKRRSRVRRWHAFEHRVFPNALATNADHAARLSCTVLSGHTRSPVSDNFTKGRRRTFSEYISRVLFFLLSFFLDLLFRCVPETTFYRKHISHISVSRIIIVYTAISVVKS